MTRRRPLNQGPLYRGYMDMYGQSAPFSPNVPGYGGTNYTADPFSPDANPATGERDRFLGAIGGAAGTLGQGQGIQGEAAGLYRDMALGRGPSVAQAQMQQGIEAATRQQLAAQAQAGGGNLAAMSQQTAGIGAANQLAANQQAAQLRAAEQQQAMAGLAGLGGQIAGQGLQQQLGYEGLKQGMELGLLDAETQRYMWEREQAEKERQGRFGRIMGTLNPLAGGLGGIFGGLGR